MTFSTGTQEYSQKYASGIIRVSKTFKDVPTYSKETVDVVDHVLSSKMPVAELTKWRKWRDTRLSLLAKLFSTLFTAFI